LAGNGTFLNARRVSQLRLFVAVVVLALVAGCVSRIDGTPTALFSTYTPPDDGSGYGLPIDQPMPLPRTSFANVQCDWIDDALPALAPLGLKYANGTGSGCQFGSGEPEDGIIQVHLAGPYVKIQQSTAMLEPVEVAGIPGRVYVFEPVSDKSFCSVALDIRAYSDFAVDGFDHEDVAADATDNKENCELAKKAADILVRKYVPLAGGTPFPGTEQRADDEKLRELKPCEFVDDTNYTPVTDEDAETGTTDFGTTCTYADENGTVRELITDGDGGLADLPLQLEDSQATTTTFGDYPARQEQSDEGCVLAIETGDGQVLAIGYTNDDPVDTACQIVSARLAVSISDQIW
jgi:hypothetical protein